MADVVAPLGAVRRVLVVGVGASGVTATRALRAAGLDVTVADDRADAEGFDQVRDLGAVPRPEAAPPQLLADVDLVVPSPGVSEHAAVLRTALERGLPVWSEPELGWRLHPRRVLAVTGTNGKTSTTQLVTAMLQEGGVEAIACGNIGRPFTEAAAQSDPEATLVAELSSFQLRFCHQLRPEVGILLNLAPDHLDWHGGLEPYGRAKARMWRAQEEGDWAVVNADDPHTLRLARDHAPAGIACFSGTGTQVGGCDGSVVVRDGRFVSQVPGAEGELLRVDQLALTAPHHVANTAAAATAALLAGIAPGSVSRAAAAFEPGRHRVEVVAQADGVTWVDDSKATNPHAAAASLSAFRSVVWIAGGISKGVDLSVLVDSLGPVRHAVLIGEAADELARMCAGCELPASRAASMREAVEVAARVAEPGDTVLLAPACSSFDMFQDYADRGDQFAAAARQVTEVTGGGA